MEINRQIIAIFGRLKFDQETVGPIKLGSMMFGLGEFYVTKMIEKCQRPISERDQGQAKTYSK